MIDAGQVNVTNEGVEAIPLAILYENRGGNGGYRAVTDVRVEASILFPELTSSIAHLRNALAN